MDVCQEETGGRPRRVEPGHAWLVDQGVEPWMGPESLPLWLHSAAKLAGPTFRPLAESVRSTLAWENELGLDRERRAGPGTQWERDLVARWEH